MTPEGKVKALVKKLLADQDRWGYIWSWWPVPSGYGLSALDCIGSYRGYFFAVETKAPGEKPTPRQSQVIQEMSQADGAVFVVDGPSSLKVLEDWLERRQGDPREAIVAFRELADHPPDYPGSG